MDSETLAKELHGAYCYAYEGPCRQWDKLTETERDVRRTQAVYLLGRLNISLHDNLLPRETVAEAAKRGFR
jgi:hypothetical protein